MVTNHIFKKKLKVMALPFFALGLFAANLSVQPAFGMEEESAKEKFKRVPALIQTKHMEEAENLFKSAMKMQHNEAISILEKPQMPKVLQLEILRKLPVINLFILKKRLEKGTYKGSKEVVAQALYERGMDYSVGQDGVSIKTQRILEKADQLGSSEAMMTLGSLFIVYDQNGNSYPLIQHEYMKRQHEFCQRAASLENADALYHLASGYLMGRSSDRGIIVEKNPQKAMELFNVAIEKNHKQAVFFMASCYEEGKDGVEKNPQKALELFEKAYDLKHTEAGSKLVYFYRDGVERNINKYIRILKESAMMKQEDCMLDLAMLYIKGDIIEQDLNEAFRWLNKINNDYFDYYTRSSENYVYFVKNQDRTIIDFYKTKMLLLSLIEEKKKENLLKKNEEENNKK